MLGHLWFTRYLILIIIIDEEGIFHVCIDGAHAVNADGKGYSGLLVTMGTCAIIHSLKILGVGTISSTEIEVVSAGESFPKCTWFR